MGNRSRTRAATDRRRRPVTAEWTQTDLALLEELKRAEALLPDDAPRALLSVRLSVLTADTTSPVRQELDLRALARDRGCRVVGVASDLNVSATKIPPWKRKELGDWLSNRVPEFDDIFFWKLDRFVRRLSDLNTMIDWCLEHGKNLVSKNDSIDLTTTAGKMLVTVLGGIAEIEAANASTRVASLWNYTKTQSNWLVGKPPYGYETAEGTDGKVVLVINQSAYRILHWCRSAAVRQRPASARRMVKVLVRSGVCGQGLTASTLLRRLRNPALMGYRVEEDKNGGVRRSQIVRDKDGAPIRVAEPVFTEDEFKSLQEALEGRGKNQPTRSLGGATRLLGILICQSCGTNMTVQKTTAKGKAYAYLRCGGCKAGGHGAPNPNDVYSKFVEDVLKVLGDEPVLTRKYHQGTEARGDQWVAVHNGMTFRERWQDGGLEVMSADLSQAGVQCKIERIKEKGVRAPHVRMKLMIPEDVRERLVLKQDPFTEASSRPDARAR
ncbi:recombinase family protein [Streptomyces sp. NPDC002092]